MHNPKSTQPATTGAPKANRGHLTAVPSPQNFTDRRDAKFIKKFVELSLPPIVDDRPNAKRRILGYGLRPGPADLMSALIELLGTAYDGKHGAFVVAAPINPSYLHKRYGWSYDQIAGWTKALERHIPCPYCERGHALLNVRRPKRGGSYTYILVRCQNLTDTDCIAYADALPKPRPRTGAAPGSQPRKHQQLELGIPVPPKTTDFPEDLIERATRIVITIASFHDLVIDDAIARRIATATSAAGATTAAAYEDALLRLTAIASINGRALATLDDTEMHALLGASPLANATTAHDEPSTPPSIPGKVSDFSDTSWSVNRCLELARQSEPGTTLATATRYRDELVTMLRKHGIRDPEVIDNEVMRILTDPRVVGTHDRPQKIPIMRLLRKAMGEPQPWILTPAHLDDGSGQYARAYEKIAPGQRDAIAHLIRAHLAGDQLDRTRLRALGVSSQPMIHYVIENIRTAQPP